MSEIFNLHDINVTGNESYFNDDVTFFRDVTIGGGLNVSGLSTFKDNALFKKDVRVEGTLDSDFVLVRTRLDVGLGGTALNIDTRTERIGIFTSTPVQKFQFNSDTSSSVVITDEGRVGIGKTNPELGISGLNTATQGELKLDIDGSISISRNLYDSAGSPGANAAFLNRDENGIRWVTFEPAFSEGIFVQDEGVFIPIVGTAQSFTVLNYVQTNSFGLGTDTTIPIPDPSNPLEIARIQTQDLWGYTEPGVGNNTPIYRMTNVGIGITVPSFTLDVNGTLNVNSATTLNNILDVDGATTLNNILDVDGDTTLNATLDVDGDTTLNATLDVDGIATFNNTTDATSTLSASVQIDGGLGIVKKLFVGDDTKIESTTNSTDKDNGALIVEGGVGIDKNLNVGENTKLIGSLELDSTLIDVNGSDALGKKDYRLSSVGTAVSWRPPGVETKNTIWVSKDGDNSNSGFLEGDAKATIGAAAAVALEGDTIKIRPGRYVEDNPIGLRTDVSITGEDIRLVTIQPQNLTSDVFWVRRGCLIENLNFAGETVGFAHTGCGAVAFPITGQNANSGYIPGGPATQGSSGRWRSPYVRNCTNFMTGSIGMRIDGNDAVGEPDGANLKSMVCDSFTQYNENGIGVSLTNNAYAQLVSIFTINNDIAIYADTGAQCDLTNSNSSFGNFGLVAVGLGSTQYSGIVSNTNLAGEIITSTLPIEQDSFVGANVFDSEGDSRRPFDGQAAYFKIDLGNYPDAVGSGRITAPLQELSSIQILNGGTPGQFSQSNPPDVLIRDIDGTATPKGPQGILAEASANISIAGTITSIDVINSGRNYLSTQNIVVDIDGGNLGFATAVMEPIYFTVSEATDNRGTTTGITTVIFNEFIPYELFPGDPFTLQRISRILTSSHSFEYVGSGISINNSLPFEGAQPIKANEIVASKGAQIPFTSTDQKGNFDIGEGIQIDQTTSTVRGRDFSKAIQAEVTPLILALR